jgi:hypothetical protein
MDGHDDEEEVEEEEEEDEGDGARSGSCSGDPRLSESLIWVRAAEVDRLAGSGAYEPT